MGIAVQVIEQEGETPMERLGETKVDIPTFTFKNHTGNRFSGLWTV